jgi:hypothetical protein
MPVDYQSLPTIPQGLVEELRKLHPVKLSQKSEDDWDRGYAWGVQYMINYLEQIYNKQHKKQ